MLRRGGWPYGLAAVLWSTFVYGQHYGPMEKVSRTILTQYRTPPTFAAKGDFDGDGLEDIAIGLAGSNEMFLRRGIDQHSDGSIRYALVFRALRQMDVWEKRKDEIRCLYSSRWERDLAPGTVPTSPQLIDIDSEEVLWILAESIHVKNANELLDINNAALPTTGSGWTIFEQKVIRSSNLSTVIFMEWRDAIFGFHLESNLKMRNNASAAQSIPFVRNT